MKVFIFGTGLFLRKYGKYIPQKCVLGYLDNNENKVGRKIDDKMVYSPYDVDFDKIDYVFVLISRYKEVFDQLISIGVDRNKLCTYKDIYRFFGVGIHIHYGDEVIRWQDLINTQSTPRVLLISLDLSRTGVPVAVMHVAALMKKIGWLPVIGALSEGTLSMELKKKKIGYLDNLGFVSNDSEFVSFINSFDCIFAGTMAAVYFLSRIEFYNKTTVLWINEKYENVFEYNQLPEHRENYLYYADGEKAAEVFRRYYPDRIINQLYYYLPDNECSTNSEICDTPKLKFTFIGYMSYRKAPDLIIRAVEKMDDELRKEISVLFVGKQSDELQIDWKKIINNYPEIQYCDEVSQDELIKIFGETDVLVCPSRDETVPIVVTQAFQNSIPCIVSDEVGQASMMNGNCGGFVFPKDDVTALINIMRYCVNNRKELIQKGKQGREIFEKYFSENTMKEFVEDKLYSAMKSINNRNGF